METGISTYGQIKSHAASVCQDPSSTFDTIIGDFINDEYERLTQKTEWASLRGLYKDTLSFTANQGKFYCPRDVLTPIALLDSTSSTYLENIPFQEVMYGFPSTFDSGSNPISISAVEDEGKSRPFYSSAEKIKIVSSASADTSKACRLWYRDSNGIELSESISTNGSNGTTEVQSTATISDIIRFSSSVARTGVITLTGVTSGYVYLRLSPNETTIVHKVLYVVRQPTSANSAVLLFKRAVPKLKNSDDVPLIPVGHYLRRCAVAFGFNYRGKDAEAARHYEEAAGILADTLNDVKSGDASAMTALPRRRPDSFHGSRWGGWRSSNA